MGRCGYIGHVHDVAHLITWNVISKEMFVFISVTATIEFDVAARCLLTEIRQLAKVLASHCQQTQLIYYCQCVYILPLHVFPLALAGHQIHPEET